MINIKIKKSIVLLLKSSSSETFKKIKPAIKERIKPPATPAYVLLGLILVNFGPFKNLPKTYPPISVKIQTQIIIQLQRERVI